MTPSNQTRNAMLIASQEGARLFRLNVGLAWVGEIIERTAQKIVLANPRPFKAGVPGMCDTGGWVTLTITPEMVGQKIAIPAYVELKSGSGRLSTEQTTFIEVVRKSGGRAGVARTDDDVRAVLRGEDRLK